MRSHRLIAGPGLGYCLDGQPGSEDSIQPAGQGPARRGDRERPVPGAHLLWCQAEGPRLGGGISNAPDDPTNPTQFTSSTVSGNRAGAHGGGLYNLEAVEATGTQVTGNRATGGGGGIYDGPDATVALTGSSAVGNKPDNCEPTGSITGCTG
jgi:hypothetical protein